MRLDDGGRGLGREKLIRLGADPDKGLAFLRRAGRKSVCDLGR